MRRSIALTLAALPLAFFLAPGVQGKSSQDMSSLSVALLMREPVLNFDVTGSTLLGAFHTRLTVYNDGLVTGSTCGGFNGENSGGTTVATLGEVNQLQADLIAAGGLVLPDQNIQVSDVPLTTVSVFKGTTNARCHTFSYWGGAPYDEIGDVIADFMAKHPVICQGIFETE